MAEKTNNSSYPQFVGLSATVSINVIFVSTCTNEAVIKSQIDRMP